MAKAVSKKEVFTKKLGRHIAKLRREAGLNQSELASLCDKDRQSIQRLESGGMNPTAFYLSEIAIALNVPLKELLDFE
jgi:transcriptional regulator with XRE-family HTH domain